MSSTPFICLTHFSPPSELLSWLNVAGSLTAVLEVKAGQPLRVERSFEGYRLLSLAQKKQLNVTGAMLNRPMLAWVREAQLYGNDEHPWVAAQSIFPLPSLKVTPAVYSSSKARPSVMCYLNAVGLCPISVLSSRLLKVGNGKHVMIGMVASC